MEIEIKDDKTNKLLGRREVQLGISYSGSTPKKDVIKEEACKKLSADPELTVIHKVNQLYGNASSVVMLRVYSNKESMKKFEPRKETKAKAEKPKKDAAGKKEEGKAETKEEGKES